MFDSAPDNTALQRVIYQIMWSTFCYRQGSEMTGMGFSHMYENFIHKNGNRQVHRQTAQDTIHSAAKL